jgi:hypothetical protein
VRLRSGWVAVALTLTGCTVPPPRPSAPPATPPQTTSIAEFAARIDADARLSEHESNPQTRAQIAAEARRDADACLAQAAQAVACIFGNALALGLEARVHATHAPALLKDMLAALAQAETIDPAYEEAGPARVQALVLARAPPWPLGPGDGEQAVAAARRATSLRPAYPPNWLALAEAQAKSGAALESQASYARARDAARALPDSADQRDWLQQSEQHLGHAP